MSSESDILARLVRREQGSADQDDPWAALAATEPAHEANPDQEADGDAKLNGLLQRISNLTRGTAGDSASDGVLDDAKSPGGDGEESAFIPREPRSLAGSGAIRKRGRGADPQASAVAWRSGGT